MYNTFTAVKDPVNHARYLFNYLGITTSKQHRQQIHSLDVEQLENSTQLHRRKILDSPLWPCDFNISINTTMKAHSSSCI